MFKRLRWLILGAIIGVFVYRKARSRVRQAAPQGGELIASASEGARRIGERLTDALVAGRQAMREEQERLEAEILRG
jgi:hypothetical protein